MAACRLRKIQAVASLTGAKFEEVPQEATSDLSKLSPIAILPLLETKEGVFFSSNTIIRFLASTAENKLYGGDNIHFRTLIDQWLDTSACELEAAVTAVHIAKEGKELDTKALAADVHKFLQVLEKALSDKKFLVGDALSIADISLATSVSSIFSIMLGKADREKYGILLK